MMMMSSTSSSPPNDLRNDHSMSMSCSVSWKLYHNPFYSSATSHPHISQLLKHQHLQRKFSASAKHIHKHRHLKMSNNCWEVELDQTRARVAELKAELQSERKLCKKMESFNKRLSRELADHQDEERRMCDEISRLREEMDKMKKEMEEERKMLRLAEVFREERLQMKLADAHHFYQHQFLKLESIGKEVAHQLNSHPVDSLKTILATTNAIPSSSTCSSSSPSKTSATESRRSAASERSNAPTVRSDDTCSKNHSSSPTSMPRKASVEPENPHIKRGIKGFVEFPRAFKAMNGSHSIYSNAGGSKNSRFMGSKLECQKAQLQILYKHRCPLPLHPLILG